MCSVTRSRRDADRRCLTRSLSAAGQQLYSHAGSSGETFWSPTPPNSACEETPPPIYFEPMCIEEPSPEPDVRMLRTASRAARMVSTLAC